LRGARLGGEKAGIGQSDNAKGDLPYAMGGALKPLDKGGGSRHHWPRRRHVTGVEFRTAASMRIGTVRRRSGLDPCQGGTQESAGELKSADSPHEEGIFLMSNTPHTLAEEFPGQMDAIHNLKISDAHFARLLREYDEVNDEIHRAETNVAPMVESAEIDLRKKRLHLKDAIAATLAAAT
jgi:uncharacterized protein YdcH (DUF465 family)